MTNEPEMKITDRSAKTISRRKLLPLLLGTLVIPYLGIGNKPKKYHGDSLQEGDRDYETFLKADGTVVRVKKSSLGKARVIKKKVSNKSLLHWLKKH